MDKPAETRHPLTMCRSTLACFVFMLTIRAEPTTPAAIAKEILASLLDPVKVATL